MTGHAPIRVRSIASISIPTYSKIRRDPQLFTDIQKSLAQRLARFKRGLESPYANPREQPSNPIPVAMTYYMASVHKGMKKKRVRPGRLRKAAALGFTWGYTRGSGWARAVRLLAGWRPGRTLIFKWGIPNRFFGGVFINYAGYVSRMPGRATGGGGRMRWHIRFVDFVQARLRQIVNQVNQEFGLLGGHRLAYFTN